MTRAKQMDRAVRFRLAWALVFVPALLLAAQTPGSLAPEKIERIEALIRAEMERQRIPGLSVAVVLENELRWSEGFGFADIENQVPAKATTVYRLGSISKPITAVAVLQLAERGTLDLDAPIQRYCSAFPAKPWPLTSRHLLAHQSGIRHYRSEAEFNSTRPYASIVDALDIFKDDSLLFEPSTRFSYTTYGYNVLGCVVEGASNMHFADYLRDNIFRPAGMERTRPDSVADIIPDRAQGYRKNDSGELRNSALADTSNKVPGGGLVGTVEDLVRFALALQKGSLVSAETREAMWTAQKTRDGQQTSYGLGWQVQLTDGRKEVAHSGAQQRVSTLLYVLPEQRFAVALMANLEGVERRGELARKIAEIVLD